MPYDNARAMVNRFYPDSRPSCQFFQNGICWFGDKCYNKHDHSIPNSGCTPRNRRARRQVGSANSFPCYTRSDQLRADEEDNRDWGGELLAVEEELSALKRELHLERSAAANSILAYRKALDNEKSQCQHILSLLANAKAEVKQTQVNLGALVFILISLFLLSHTGVTPALLTINLPTAKFLPKNFAVTATVARPTLDTMISTVPFPTWPDNDHGSSLASNYKLDIEPQRSRSPGGEVHSNNKSSRTLSELPRILPRIKSLWTAVRQVLLKPKWGGVCILYAIWNIASILYGYYLFVLNATPKVKHVLHGISTGQISHKEGQALLKRELNASTVEERISAAIIAIINIMVMEAIKLALF